MMTLIAAAAVAAAQPAPAQAPAAPAPPMTQHHEQMKAGQHADHKDMDCCKDCCRDMAAKREGHKPDHSGHSSK